MMVNKIILGKSDLRVSPLTFGGNVFGWTINERESFKILDAFVGGGFNFIDTADSYSTWVPGNLGGESETIIGNWLKKNGKRKDVIIATKLGGDLGGGKKGLSKRYIKEAVEASLSRLQTDYIDLYQSHYDDPDTKVSETMVGLNDLIKEGKVRFIGASNLSTERIKASNEFARTNNLNPYVTLQPLYNLYDRQKFEEEYLGIVNAEGLGVLSYYSLASGFLTGKYRKETDLMQSQRGHSVKSYFTERGDTILQALDKVAADQKASPAQIALAWLLHKPFTISPIASATNEQQLTELMAGASIRLTPDQVSLLDSASAWLASTTASVDS